MAIAPRFLTGDHPLLAVLAPGVLVVVALFRQAKPELLQARLALLRLIVDRVAFRFSDDVERLAAAVAPVVLVRPLEVVIVAGVDNQARLVVSRLRREVANAGRRRPVGAFGER